MSDELVEPFTERPARCPKCDGHSSIHRYIQGGNPIRDTDGCFRFVMMLPQEHLVVKCQVCDYERLMEVAHASSSRGTA